MIKLRHAAPADSEYLFLLRNDPFVYERYDNARPVEREEHEIWYDRAIMNANSRLFIITLTTDLVHDGEIIKDGATFQIGQIRFNRDPETNQASVSIGMLEKYTGKGYGTEAIRQGCKRIVNIWNRVEIIAWFLPNNCASKKAFRKAGFVNKDGKATLMRWNNGK